MSETQSKPVVPPTPYARLTALLTSLHAHPIAVHTPNGVLPVALALIALGGVFGSEGLIRAGWYNIIFVALTMPAVLFTGYVDWHNRYRGARTKVFNRKIAAGIVTAACSIFFAPLPLIWPELLDPSAPARFKFLLLVAINLAPAVYAGHLGGRLVFAGKKP